VRCPGLATLHGRERLVGDSNQHRLVHGLAAVRVLGTSGNTVSIDPTRGRPLRRAVRFGPRRRSRNASRCVAACPSAAVRGCASNGKKGHDAEDAHSSAEQSAEQLSTLLRHHTAFDDGGREGLRSASIRERVTLLDNGPRGMRYLPRHDADAEEQESATHGRANFHGCASIQ